MEKMRIYNAVREVPAEAKKTINAGRLKGMTDINPMWRIKALTENFGPCGVGWYYTIDGVTMYPGAGDEVMASVEISLYIRYLTDNGETWSKPIKGVGGSMFIVNESKGLRTNDEAVKMALTDALSVSCKALGMGADVYWNGDRTKYTAPAPATAHTVKDDGPTLEQKNNLIAKCKLKGVNIKTVLEAVGCSGKMTNEQYKQALKIVEEFNDIKEE